MLFGKDEISVLVVSLSDKVESAVSELLKVRVYPIVKCVGSISEAKRMMLMQHFDMVVINAPLHDETGVDFAVSTAGDSDAGILLLIHNEYYDSVTDAVMGQGVLTVAKPLSKQLLYEALNLMTATHFRLRKLETKNAKLTAKIEEIRLVNHAKWVLIENLGVTEEEAHKMIEKQAMDTRQTKQEVAESILRTYH